MSLFKKLAFVVGLLGCTSPLMGWPSFLELLDKAIGTAYWLPETIEVIYPDTTNIVLSRTESHLFPTIERLSKTTGIIHINQLRSMCKNPFISLDYDSMRRAIRFALMVNKVQGDSQLLLNENNYWNCRCLPVEFLEELVYTLHFLEVDKASIDEAAKLLFEARKESESFLHDMLNGEVNLKSRWHPNPDWNLLNLSDLGITSLGDIALAVDTIPCDEIEYIYIKNNPLQKHTLTVKEIDALYKLFPRLKEIL